MLLISGEPENKKNHRRLPVGKARDLVKKHSASNASAMKY